MFWWLIFLLLALLCWYIYWTDYKRIGQPAARRRLRGSIIIFLVIYLGTLGVLLGLENKLIYHPDAASEYWSPPPSLHFEDVSLRSAAGDTIHAWWCPMHEGASVNDGLFTILFSHGNAGNLSGHSWIIEEMRVQFHCNVLIYDYPGYGKSTGKPSESGCYASADAAYAWLIETKKIPPQKIILMGQSLGCAMACDLAVNKDHRALVLLSPFTSIRDVGQEIMPIFPVKWLMSHHYDNQSKLTNYQKPLLIGHGTADEVIPFHHGQRLFEAAGSKEKTFHTIPGGHHNDLAPGFFQALRDFLNMLAK